MTGRSNMADKALAGRWSDTMAIIVMFHEASGKKKIRMASYLPSWSRTDHPKSTERTGPD